ncbi:hypothetical protein D3C81_852050 [compost metagenome]
MVFHQVRHSLITGFAWKIPVVLLPVVVLWMPGRMARYVDHKSQIERTGTRSASRSPMGFTDMDRIIAVGLENTWKWCSIDRMGNIGYGAQSIDIPVRRIQQLILTICGCIGFGTCPVCNPVMCCIQTCEKAHP